MKINSENGRTICKSYMQLEVNVKIYKELVHFNRKTSNTTEKLTRSFFKYVSKKDWKMANWHIKKKGSMQLVIQFSSVQSLSRVQLSVTPWIAARQASMSSTNSQSSLRLTSIESVMPSSHLILCHPLLLPPIPPSIEVWSKWEANPKKEMVVMV